MTKYRKIQEDMIMHHLPQINDSLTIIIGNLQLLAEQRSNEEARLRELICEGKKIHRSITMLFPQDKKGVNDK